MRGRAVEKPQVPGAGDSLGTARRCASPSPQAAPNPLGQRCALPTPAWTTLRVAHFPTAPTTKECSFCRNEKLNNLASTGKNS